MKKKVLAVTALSFVLAGCVPLKQSRESTPVPAAQDQSLGQTKMEFAEVAAAIKLGKAARCVMQNTTLNQSIEYVIKGKKMRMHASSTTANMPASSMISDGEFLYTWTEKDKKGMKIKVPTQEEGKQIAEDAQKLPDLSQESEKKRYENLGYTIDCSIATAEDTEFIPPPDVTFTDLSGMMDMAKKMPNKSNK